MKNETEALNEAIIELQQKRAKELVMLKEQLHTTYESLKPFNMIKSKLHEVSSSPDLKSNIISNAIGIGTGLLSKRFLGGSSHNPVKRLFGTLIQFAVASVVSKHADAIKSAGDNLYQRFLKYREVSKKEFHHNGTEQD